MDISTALQVFAACVVSVALLFFSLAFVVNWLRFRRQVRPYRRYGFAAACVIIGFEILALTVSPSLLTGLSVVLVILIDAWVMVRTAAFTNVGIYYSMRLGHSGFPLFMRRFPPRPESAAGEPPAAAPIAQANSEAPAPAEAAASAIVEQLRQHTLRPDVTPKQALLAAAAVAAGAAAFTAILFTLTSPRVSEFVRSFTSFDAGQVATERLATPFMLVFVLEVAVSEEIIFRLGIQNFLANVFNWRERRYWTAILFTSILWTLAHVGVIEPWWVKPAQIFPIGLALGWLYWRYGAETSMLAHGLFNVAGLLLTPTLMT
ncbi:MAG TPA: CPBP family intramembrane glutamic endopeptidase [Anaerolineae bacterium]|nr:CPBP family intramembrane glutamic endopeptidase [Anaerolineae bacterium]